jgi:hypothetical protein
MYIGVPVQVGPPSLEVVLAILVDVVVVSVVEVFSGVGWVSVTIEVVSISATDVDTLVMVVVAVKTDAVDACKVVALGILKQLQAELM